MITDFKEIEKFFTELDNTLNTKTNVYVIGGATLLQRGMKAATKDIDLIVSTKKEFLNITEALIKLKFKTRIPGKEYAHMNLSQIFQREDFRIDLFEKEVCAKFSLSKNMIQRAEQILTLKNLNVSLCSNEDIFLFKTMTEREGDITDCISIATTQNPNWNIILKELKEQITERKQDIWITWIGERLDILIERGIDIPIIKEIDTLREEYFLEFEKKHQ